MPTPARNIALILTASLAALMAGHAGSASAAEFEERLGLECGSGVARSCSELGRRLLIGLGLPRSDPEAFRYHRRACDLDAARCHEAATLTAAGLGTERDDEAAATLHRHACEAGSTEGCRQLGSLHLSGRGVPRSLPASLKFQRRACEGGNAKGCRGLALHFLAGHGTRREPERGAELLDGACRDGDGASCLILSTDLFGGVDRDRPRDAELQSRAGALLAQACTEDQAAQCFWLGRIHHEGLGVSKSSSEAVRFFRRGCELRDGRACLALGQSLLEGDGVEAAVEEGLRVLRTGCEDSIRGASACRALGRLLHDGEAVALDRAEATRLYERACNLGLARGCSALASELLDGHGVERDTDRALELLEESCREAFDPSACFKLATIFEKGEVVDRDGVRARGFRRKACRLGNKGACAELEPTFFTTRHGLRALGLAPVLCAALLIIGGRRLRMGPARPGSFSQMESERELRAVIPLPRSNGTAFLLFLLPWTAGGLLFLQVFGPHLMELAQGQVTVAAENRSQVWFRALFVVLWHGMWLLAIYALVRNVLFRWMGVMHLQADEDAVRISIEAGAFRWKRSYRSGDLDRLVLSPPNDRPSEAGNLELVSLLSPGSRLALMRKDWGLRFGAGLSDAESTALADALVNRIPSLSLLTDPDPDELPATPANDPFRLIPVPRKPAFRPRLRETLVTRDVKPIVAANLVPAVGALFLSWPAHHVLLTYWLETVVMGLWTIPKILLSRGTSEGRADSASTKLFIVSFFCLHYGGFMKGGLAWIGELAGLASGAGSLEALAFVGRELVASPTLVVALAAMTWRHGHEFRMHWLTSSQCMERHPVATMFTPYNRVFVMAFAIVFGGWALQVVGAPAASLVMLVVIKVWAELRWKQEDWDRHIDGADWGAGPAAST